MPEVSIITVVKDDSSGLTATYNSLKRQDFQDWEMIIIASPSSDDTLENARALEQADQKLTLVIEQQSGIYLAMNVGLHMANAKYVWFMNSGDIFFNNKILGISVDSIKAIGVGILLGGYVVGGNLPKIYIKSKRKIGVQLFSANIRGGCHQSMLFQRSATPSMGYDLKFDLASDFDFVLKTISTAGAFRTDTPLAIISPKGLSHTRIMDVLREKQAVRKKFFGTFSIPYLIGFFLTIGIKVKILIRSFFCYLNKK